MKRPVTVTAGGGVDTSPAAAPRNTGDGAIRAIITGTRAPERPIHPDTAARIRATKRGAFVAALESDDSRIARMFGGGKAARQSVVSAAARGEAWALAEVRGWRGR